MMDKPYITVVIPVYNEEGNIRPLFDRLYPVTVSYTHLTLPTILLV